ncbi:MAG: hypothetical protein ACTSQP_13430 [Promethearchaeota archaeon]
MAKKENSKEEISEAEAFYLKRKNWIKIPFEEIEKEFEEIERERGKKYDISIKWLWKFVEEYALNDPEGLIREIRKYELEAAIEEEKRLEKKLKKLKNDDT